jgi:dihydropteroate synthase
MNARVLSAEAGLDPADRLAPYLPPEALEAARDAASVAMLALDAPPPAAFAVAEALRARGAFARCDDLRLIVVATASALRAAREAVSGEGALVLDELLRAFEANRLRPEVLRLRDHRFEFAGGAKVMGILNVTPDSFFDSGKYSGLDRARARALEMVELGADLIDIGGQSYAHWNPAIAASEERERVVPVVAALIREGLGVPLSIDTWKSGVAEAALDAGAHLINDCSGLADERMPAVVARYDAGLVVMHLKGRLNVRAAEYRYVDALAEISDFLRERLERAEAGGVSRDSLIVDPGLEFGKDPATDLEILERFGDLRALGVPILFAASRKSFIGRIFARPAKELLVPSLATAALGIAAGARLVRVHDVAETKQLARMLAASLPAGRAAIDVAAAMPGTPAGN